MTEIEELRKRVEALEACDKEDANCWQSVRASMHELRERVIALEATQSPSPSAERMLALQDQIRDGALTLADALKEIGAALDAQHEPVALTDGESQLLVFARAIQQRSARPAIHPVPVSERLPKPGDCDAEGGCWWWHPDHKSAASPSAGDCGVGWPHSSEDDFDDGWILLNPKWAGGRHDSDDSLIFTHWLPHWALPMPIPSNNTREENLDG